jgi:hypothetical protein
MAMESLGILVGALIASATWLYQLASQRQEKRVDRYAQVMSRLCFFTTQQLQPREINKMIAEHHRLWLFAPDDVVRAGEHFLDTVQGNASDAQQALNDYVLAMRRDASLTSALFPRFWKTNLKAEEFHLRSASDKSGCRSPIMSP